MAQMLLGGFITCKVCEFGRNLGADDWGCRSNDMRNNGEKLVHKGDFTCDYAKEKEE